MSAPSPSTATPRADLAVTLMAYDAAAVRQGFVSQALFPVFETPRAVGTFSVLSLAQMLQSHPTERAPDGSYNRADFRVGGLSYSTTERGFEVPVDDNLRSQYRDYLDAEAAAAQIAQDIVLRANEQAMVDKVLNGNRVTATAAAAKWDTGTAKPIDDVRAAKFRVRARTGILPNVVVMEAEAFELVREAPQIIDKIGSSGSGDPKLTSREALARIFNVEEVIIAEGSKNVAIPNEVAEYNNLQLAPLWDRAKVLVAFRDRRNMLTYPTFGRIFHYADDGSEIGARVETYRDERVRGDVVRARNQVDVNLLIPELGEIITTVL